MFIHLKIVHVYTYLMLLVAKYHMLILYSLFYKEFVVQGIFVIGYKSKFGFDFSNYRFSYAICL